MMMSDLKELYKKHEEGILYLFFGGLTTVVNWGTYAILVTLGLEINLSNIISWIVGVTYAFTVMDPEKMIIYSEILKPKF